MDQIGLLDDLEERPDQPLRFDLHATEPADLANHDRERDAGEEAGQDRPRQEGREYPQPQRAGDEAEYPDGERQQRGHGDAVGRHPRRRVNRREHRRQHRHRRRVRANDQLPRRAEDRIGHGRRDAGVEARLRRQAGDRRIGDGARQPHRGDRQSCGDIALQPGRPVALQARQKREAPFVVGRHHLWTNGQCAARTSVGIGSSNVWIRRIIARASQLRRRRGARTGGGHRCRGSPVQIGCPSAWIAILPETGEWNSCDAPSNDG